MKINNAYKFMAEAPILTIIILCILGSMIIGSIGAMCSGEPGVPTMNCRGNCAWVSDKEELECLKECFKANEEITKAFHRANKEKTNVVRDR